MFKEHYLLETNRVRSWSLGTYPYVEMMNKLVSRSTADLCTVMMPVALFQWHRCKF